MEPYVPEYLPEAAHVAPSYFSFANPPPAPRTAAGGRSLSLRRPQTAPQRFDGGASLGRTRNLGYDGAQRQPRGYPSLFDDGEYDEDDDGELDGYGRPYHVPRNLRKTTAEAMLGLSPRGKQGIPAYDSLSDPALADFYARKFGWTMSARPAPGARRATTRGPKKGKRGGARGKNGSGSGVYLVKITTGRHSSPHSESAKYVVLFGQDGRSSRTLLAAPGRHFLPNQTDTFKVRADDVGELIKVKVVNSGNSRAEAWFLATMEVTDPSGQVYKFLCNKWLSSHREDRKLECSFLANKRSMKRAVYDIEVSTGDKRGAGTDANVYITLFGSSGESVKTRLQNRGRKDFERHKTDRFTLETPSIGKLVKIRIEHDNRGSLPGWYLERVLVTHRKTNKVYLFTCQKWLAKNEGDGSILRELVPDGAEGITTYKVEVFTGDKRYAATGANAFVTLFGASGDTGKHPCKAKGQSFKRGQVATFMIETGSVGDMQRCRVEHDNSGSGAGWYVDKVVVTDTQTSKVYEFPCDRWLATDEDDGQISRELLCEGAGSWATSVYKLHVVTGDVRFAGTDATVTCCLYGSLGKSGDLVLSKPENTTNPFKRNRTDIFKIDCADLGELEHMTIGHNNKGTGAAWFLESVRVEAMSVGKIFETTCQKWLSTDNGGELVVDLPFQAGREFDARSAWKCTVHTGDKLGAGTDANVFICVYGEEGKSGEIKLQSKTDLFERNHTDELKVELSKLGKLRKLRVWHDNKGMLAGWYLGWIELEHPETGAKYRFDCDQWLATNEGDKEIMRELPATGPGIETPDVLKEYQVNVHTSNKRWSGTDANVFVDVSGSKGDTGVRPLKKSSAHRDKFERGHTDVFTVKAVDLGDLQKIRCFHDNSGMGAAWHLEKIVVVDPLSGVETVFPCNKWLATNQDDGKIDRVLPAIGADGVVENTTKYIVHVFTGDVGHAGTDANVYLTIFGESGDTGRLHLRKSTTFKDKFERGHEDIFEYETLNIGEVKRLILGHDGKGVGSGWFLDRVEIDVPSLGKMYTFKCGRWFSTQEDDKQVERELLADKDSVKAYKAMSAYECRVWTSDVRFAGTDSKVYLTIYGDAGKTDKMWLSNETDNFERKMLDTFKLEFPSVGKVSKIRLEHDNSGLIQSTWHPERLELQNLKSSVVYSFEAQRWLSKSKGDKQLVCELPIAKKEKIVKGERIAMKNDETVESVTYEVSVVTGDKSRCGTDAGVFLVVYGTDGDTGERKLAKSKTYRDKFERNHTDEFDVEAVHLGQLTKIKIWHNNTGLFPSWYLSEVRIKDPKEGKEYRFPCEQWLSKKEGDNQIVRELGVASDDVPRELQTKAVTTTYHLDVHTSDIRSAGTDSNVFVLLYGENGDSGDVPLLKSKTYRDKFERNHIDKFEVNAIDLGDIKKLKVWHDGKGLGAAWHLNKVVIDAPLLGKKFLFPCNRWLAKGEADGKLEVVLEPGSNDVEEYKAKQPWEVAIFTSSVKNAGTDANVFMEVYGKDKAGSNLKDRHDFKEAVKSHFEKGCEDRFNIELEDIGVPYKIRIGHDNKGFGASWHLDRVVMINQLSKESFEFKCDEWLAKGKGDGKIVREVMCSSETALRADGTLRKREGTLLKLGIGVKKYTVHVVTGDVKWAGTDAHVFLTAYGEHGDWGVQKLDKSSTHRDKFERGHTDTFTVEAVDLGELEKIHVWHDNRGLNASWHLDHIEIESEDGSKWLFPCKRWLSKKEDDKQISRELPVYVDPAVAAARAKKLAQTADKLEAEASHAATLRGKGSKERAQELQERADAARLASDKANGTTRESTPHSKLVNYYVSITTGDVSKAGTKAKCYVELVGRKPRANPKPGSKSRFRATTSDKLWLPAEDEHSFSRGTTRKIKLEAMDVGELRKVKIGHDGAGSGAEWYVDSVEVHVPVQGKKYLFPADAWIREGGDEGEVTLKPSSAEAVDVSVTYDVAVYTGDESFAGTDANVSLELFGENGHSDQLALQRAGDSFERHQADTFSFEIVALGLLTKARVSHDGKGVNSAWLLEKLVVTNRQTGLATVFEGGVWLSNKSGHKRSVELAASVPDGGSAVKGAIKLDQATYRVYVTTGSKSGSGTDANVSVRLFGAHGDSGDQPLGRSETHKDKFESGHTDIFTCSCLDLGQLSKLRVWHDNKGFSSSWFLDKIEVVHEQSQSKYEFPCAKWLSKNRNKDGGQVVRELSCQETDVKGRSIEYKITTVTSKKAAAPADSDILVTLHGTEGSSDELVLPLDAGNFSSGKTDHFTFHVLFLGTVTHVNLRCADTGAQWHGEQVRVTELRNGNASFFILNKPLLHKSRSIKASSKSLGLTDTIRSLKNVVYDVRVKTSGVKNAGTDANVFITLYGENGDSGERQLAKSETHRDKFEKGNVDVFKVDALDLGTLTKLKVRHDNKGFKSSAWHLEAITIKGGGEATVFALNDWISKKHGDGALDRTLLPESIESVA